MELSNSYKAFMTNVSFIVCAFTHVAKGTIDQLTDPPKWPKGVHALKKCTPFGHFRGSSVVKGSFGWGAK